MPHRYAMILVLGLFGSVLLHVVVVWPVHYVHLVKLTARRPIKVRLLGREQVSNAQVFHSPSDPVVMTAPAAASIVSAPTRSEPQITPRRPRAAQGMASRPALPAPAARPIATAVTRDSAANAQAEGGQVEAPTGATPAAVASVQTVIDLTAASSDELAPYDALVLAQIRQHQYYPRTARARRLEGRVLLFVSIAHDGALQAAEIRETSGYPVLDQAALAIVADSAPFPAPQLYDFSARRYLLPITFRITGGT